MGGKGLVLPAAVGMGDDAGTWDGSTQCLEHPQYSRANPAGGICPLCLQDKLRRLLFPAASSSSASTKPSSFVDYSAAIAAPLYSSDYSPSSPPSSSDSILPTVLEAVSYGYGRVKAAANRSSSSSANNPRGSSASRRSKMIPFFHSTTHDKKKKAAFFTSGDGSSNASGAAGSGALKRSKSVAARTMGGSLATGKTEILLDSPRKKSFWSFLYLSSSHHRHHRDHYAPCGHGGIATGRGGGYSRDAARAATTAAATTYIRDIKLLPHPPQLPAISTSAKPEDNAKNTPRRECPPAAAGVGSLEEAPGNSPGSRGSQASASLFGWKVARSRSVGCGSRSFSGDLLERISTVGLGDCTLRRVESQRESMPSKVATHQRVPGEDEELPPRHKVRCGGIFAGFSSSSSYWSSDDLGSGRIPAVTPAGSGGGENGTPRTRRSWAWAFASPMRAFSRPFSKHAAVASINGAPAAAGSPFDVASPSIVAVVGDAVIAANSTDGAAASLAVRG